MKNQNEEFIIRDLRRKQFFQVDDEYLNGYAKLCGIFATGVYISLCRHSDKRGICFPSIDLMSRELKVSRDSIMRGLKKLEEYKIIIKIKVQGTDGKFKRNVYNLLDKSQWKPKPSSCEPLGETEQPSSCERKNQVAVSYHKETQLKDTQLSNKLDGASTSQELKYEPIEEKKKGGERRRGDINLLLAGIEKIVGTLDDTKQNQRNFAKNFIDSKMRKIYKEMEIENPTEKQIVDGILRIFQIAKQDKFHSQNCRSISYVYRKAGSILQSKIAKKPKVAIIS